MATFVDDCAIAYKSKVHFDKLAADLKKYGFNFTVEASLSDFLGVKLSRHGDTSFHMTQTTLIEKIIEYTGMTDSNGVYVPAEKKPLGIDPEGDPHDAPWNYRSVTGMLMFLANNSRPDLCYSVSQCCRHNHNPKASHTKAVKKIVRYLVATKDKGTILTPSDSLNLDLYVDCDFAGLYKSDPDREPTSAKSRMGYILFFSNCPLVVKSALLNEVGLSVCEVEYGSLSYATRTLLCVQRLVKEVVKKLGLDRVLDRPSIRCTIFEDNAATYQLASTHKLTNRTRYFHVKWHWFWQYVGEGSSRLFNLIKVSTHDMIADAFTKGLQREVFERLRKKYMGW